MALQDSIVDGEAYVRRLTLRGGGTLEIDDLSWIDAAGNYVRLNTEAGQRHLVRGTLSALEKRLDPQRFIRIHRSTIVNVEHIREIRPRTHGEALIVMRDGRSLTRSRSYRDSLENFTS